MHLTCPDCGAAVPAEDVNIERGIGKCRACNAVIDVETALRGSDGGAGAVRRPPVPQPGSITVEDLGGTGLRLTRRWFTWGVLLLTVFCVIWDGFLVFWYTMALQPGAPWFAVVFPLIHVTVGVLLTYSTLAMYVNRTVLEINDGRLTVRHGPLPWPGNRDLDVSEVEQLYCEEKTSRSRQGNVSYTYKVCGLLKGGRRETLLDSLPQRDHALFVEQFIEKYLGIEDRPVGGELPRP
jgi:hypothetical protein